MLLATVFRAGSATAVIARTFVYTVISVVAASVLSHADETTIARVGQPAIVDLPSSRKQIDFGYDECGSGSGTILKVKLRRLGGGAELIVRIFLDKTDANTSSSIDDPAFVGSLALSAANGSRVQEFWLALPETFQNHRQVTIVLVAIDLVQPTTGSVSVVGAGC